jgi:hypothetical protein
MKNTISIIILTMCALALAGCANPPIVNNQNISPPITITLTIPEQNSRTDAKQNNAIELIRHSQIKLNDYRVLSHKYYSDGTRTEYPDVESLKWTFNESNFLVEKYKGFASSRGSDLDKVSVTYYGTTSTKQSKDAHELILTINKKNYTGERNILTRNVSYEVDFGHSDILKNLSEATLPWKIEIDSEFNAESVYANFSRLARRELNEKGEADPITGKIYKERFFIKISDSEIPINIEAYPYRNGSKIIIYSSLRPSISNNNLNFITTAETLKKEVWRIVNS